MAPDDFDELPYPPEEDEFDCHMMPNGHCGAAGSEDCEFECPYRREQRARYARKRAPRSATLLDLANAPTHKERG